MAATFIKVDIDTLKKTSNTFKTTGNDISRLTTNMTNEVKKLTGQIWSGDAQAAYVKKFNGLNDDIQKMNKIVTEHVTDLETIASTFKSSEDANVTLSKSLIDNPLA